MSQSPSSFLSDKSLEVELPNKRMCRPIRLLKHSLNADYRRGRAGEGHRDEDPKKKKMTERIFQYLSTAQAAPKGHLA